MHDSNSITALLVNRGWMPVDQDESDYEAHFDRWGWAMRTLPVRPLAWRCER
jgi:hypothetical protein